MSGPKCATVAPAAVSHHDYRAAQVEAARLALALALRVREERAIAAAKSRIESLVQQHAALRKRVDEARKPYAVSAQGACSRLDPQPKLSPARRICAPCDSGLLMMKSSFGDLSSL